MDEWLDFIISNCDNMDIDYLIFGDPKSIDKVICTYIRKYDFKLLYNGYSHAYNADPNYKPECDLFDILDYRGINLLFAGSTRYTNENDINIYKMNEVPEYILSLINGED